MENADYLKSVSIFSDLMESERIFIANKMVLSSYSKGDIILMEDTEGKHCFFKPH